MAACDAQIEDDLNQLPTQLPPEQVGKPVAPRQRPQKQPSFDRKHHLYRISGVGSLF